MFGLDYTRYLYRITAVLEEKKLLYVTPAGNYILTIESFTRKRKTLHFMLTAQRRKLNLKLHKT